MKIPNNICQPQSRVRGVALIVALLLLVVMTILGVASMSNVAMQERMAGNVNLQALAFEAASAGVSESLVFGFDTDKWPAGATCTRGGGEWIGEWKDFVETPVPGLTSEVEVGYRQRVGCFEPSEIPDEWMSSEYSVPVQLLVLNQGIVRAADSATGNGIGDVLSSRDIEVRIEKRGGDPTCSICVLGDLNLPGNNPMPNSSNFAVDGGEGGCPIMTQFPEGAEEIIGALEGNGNNSLVGQYTPNPPGIHSGQCGQPWSNPSTVASLANWLKLGLRNHEIHGIEQNYRSSYCLENGEEVDCDIDDISEPAEPYAWCPGEFKDFHTQVAGGGGCSGGGTSGWHELPTFNDGIHYIAGNLRMGGNATGSGTVIVEGDICWNGTTNFEGTIIGLGGSFEMVGGGGNEDKATTEGMIRLVNIKDRLIPDPWPANEWPFQYLEDAEDGEGNPLPFGTGTLDLSGGGKHEIKFDCEAAHENVASLNQCLPPEAQIPLPGCGPDFMGYRWAIASWREYIDGQRWDD